jgi:SsrA-binding protein
MNEQLYIKNKKAYFEYHVLDEYTAGIKLLGTEIKSIREGKVNLNDAFCTFISEQLYVRNLHVSEYSHGSFYNHEAKRDRVLLLNKKELKKLCLLVSAALQSLKLVWLRVKRPLINAKP